jgi:hypothetical protein
MTFTNTHLSSGFDVSSASFVDSFSVSAQDTAPTGIAFNADGTKMFIVLMFLVRVIRRALVLRDRRQVQQV